MISRNSDLAMATNFNIQNSNLQTQMNVASKEIATGMKTNFVKATGGDLAYLFAIERNISTIETNILSSQIASGKAKLTQLSLEQIGTAITPVGVDLLSAAGRDDFPSMDVISSEVLLNAESAITNFNIQYARHNLFSGAALDSKPFENLDVLIADIDNIVAAAADINAMITDIDNYFYSAGGGYETNFYLGSKDLAPGLNISSGQKLDYSTSGDATEIRELFRAFAISGIVARSTVVLATQNRSFLMEEGARALISATDSLVELRSNIGVSQAQIEQVLSENNAKLTMFELERAMTIAADPYESATKFEALRGQIETVYTMTARLSGLSLVKFLR